MTDVPVSIPQSPSAADYAKEGDRPFIPAVTEPFALLEEWLKDANETEPNDSSAMSLATVDADGMPDVRVVLLRGLSAEGGLEFYTNYDSVKGAAHRAPQSRSVFPLEKPAPPSAYSRHSREVARRKIRSLFRQTRAAKPYRRHCLRPIPPALIA